MPKAYWISAYQAVHNQDKLADYAKLAGPAIAQAGGRFLARGVPALVKEAGRQERTVLIEFDNLEMALKAYDSPAYKDALAALGEGSVVREIRIIEGA